MKKYLVWLETVKISAYMVFKKDERFEIVEEDEHDYIIDLRKPFRWHESVPMYVKAPKSSEGLKYKVIKEK